MLERCTLEFAWRTTAWQWDIVQFSINIKSTRWRSSHIACLSMHNMSVLTNSVSRESRTSGRHCHKIHLRSQSHFPECRQTPDACFRHVIRVILFEQKLTANHSKPCSKVRDGRNNPLQMRLWGWARRHQTLPRHLAAKLLPPEVQSLAGA